MKNTSPAANLDAAAPKGATTSGAVIPPRILICSPRRSEKSDCWRVFRDGATPHMLGIGDELTMRALAKTHAAGQRLVAAPIPAAYTVEEPTEIKHGAEKRHRGRA